jgi:hypothetical protein
MSGFSGFIMSLMAALIKHIFFAGNNAGVNLCEGLA